MGTLGPLDHYPLSEVAPAVYRGPVPQFRITLAPRAASTALEREALIEAWADLLVANVRERSAVERSCPVGDATVRLTAPDRSAISAA
jgi:hypothetical protein